MITSISMKSYRSLHNLSLQLKPYTVLIGRNGSGKSNLLRALQILLDDALAKDVKVSDFTKTPGKNITNKSTIEIEAQLGTPTNLKVRRVFKKGQQQTVTQDLEQEVSGQWQQTSLGNCPNIPKLYYMQPRTGAIQEQLKTSSEPMIWTLISGWMPTQFARKDLDTLMRRFSSTNSPTGKGNTMKGYNEFLKQKVEPILNDILPTDVGRRWLFPVWRSSPGASSKGSLLTYYGQNAQAQQSNTALVKSNLALDQHESGLVNVIALVLSIEVLREYHRQRMNNQPLILAIEEPEVHLHPDAQRRLARHLKILTSSTSTPPTQVLVATHSPIFVDQAEPENVVLLRREGGTAKLQMALSTKVIQNRHHDWKYICDDLGVKMSDILLRGEINFLVEGPTERYLFTAVAETLSRQGKPSIDFDRLVLVLGTGSNLPAVARAVQSTGNRTAALVDNDQSGRAMEKELRDIGCASDTSGARPLDLILVVNDPSGPCQGSSPAGKDYEIEDVLDSQELWRVFAAEFCNHPTAGSIVRGLTYQDFQQWQQQHSGNWWRTIKGLLHNKGVHGADKWVSGSKVALAKAVAREIRRQAFPIPHFCECVIQELARL